MSPTRLITTALLSFAFVACGSPATNNAPSANNTAEPPRSAGAAAQGTPAAASGMSQTQACYETEVGKDRKVLRAQTFALDFEPFKNSCFVTTHDPDFTDPPLNSEIAIYKDGKKLPVIIGWPPDDSELEPANDATGLPTSGCWVEAVAFNDVNDDRLTDVIVIAKCGTKSGAYNENLVYINNRKVLFTRPNVNAKLSDLKTIGEVLKYTKENPRLFSLIIDAAPSSN